MDFEEFKEQFAEDVKNDLEGKGIDASVKVNSVEKMNENYDALTVTPEGSNVGVNLNMNKFFEAYDSGDVDYDQVVDKAVTVIREGFENKPEIDVNALTDYEQMKDKLVMYVALLMRQQISVRFQTSRNLWQQYVPERFQRLWCCRQNHS